MSAESPRHMRCGAPPLVVPPQPPSERSIIDALSGFINDVTLSSTGNTDPKDVIQWARFETADINEPVPEGEGDNDVSPLILILGYGSGVQVWLIPPNGEAQEVLSWRQGTVRVLRILPSPQHGDCFASKRPLIALCDSASPGPTFCSLSFISIRGGEQVKSIKFKNPILDVLANKRSIVVSFSERFAVFDAATLEDRMAITTCYPCPCPLGGSTIVNPLALGEKWLAFADRKLNPTKRSGGGCEGEGVTSYTATVLHAAKSLSKGLRGLGESVAQSLAGARSSSQSPSPPHDAPVPGLVTVLDIEGIDEDESQDDEPYEPIVAHFVAHSEAVIAMKFDASGMLLVTADRRGHDFHVFRINPHPCGPSQASVHHLYVLHRGDTTAKVQDIAISVDSRWAAISTLRGTTHVFAMSPYGGWCGVRTHTSPRVVNRLSRFHRSAGLPIPAANDHHPKVSEGIAHGAWFPNPRLPPYPSPTVTTPLAQLRPTANLPTHTITRTSSGRQRLSSLSEESSAPLLARATFGAAVCSQGPKSGPVASLYLMSASGSLTHLLLHPRPARNIPKEKVCDESAIELEVTPRAQWALQRGPGELVAPLPPSNPLAHTHAAPRMSAEMCMSSEERWLSQVEIVTHAGPHRRLWMGPQFLFKTFNFTGSSSSLSEAETVEVEASARGAARSNPVNMPCVRPAVPVLVDSGSASSLEQSPCEGFRRKSQLAESGRAASLCDVQLKEDLAEAMKEDHGREVGSSGGGGAGVSRCVGPRGTVVACGGGRPSGPSGPAPPARRLPAGTTIPAQPAARAPSPPALPLPLPLDAHVLIPAALLPRPHSDTPLPRASDDIHPTARLRDKQSPTRKLSDRFVAEPKPDPKRRDSSAVKDARERASDASKQAKVSDKDSEKTVVSAIEIEVKAAKDKEVLKETKSKISKSKDIDIPKDTKPKSSNVKDSFKEIPLKDEVKKESLVSKDEQSITVSLPAPSKKQSLESMSSESYEEIKTEEQAWDMLLSEPEKPAVLNVSKSVVNEKEADDSKPKSKKSKQKKALETTQSKSEEDSFVEIHAIEDKPPKPSSELVSIPDPLDEKHVDLNTATSTYASKSKKSRSSKSVTPEVNVEDNASSKQEKQTENTSETIKPEKSAFEAAISLETHILLKPKAYSRKKYSSDFPAASSLHESPTRLAEPVKTNKSKSLSPIPDPRKSIDADKKDVYVIDTTEMNFPDIQVTKGLKSQKNLKAPQPAARKSLEKETVIEKPIKSLSSIAASKKTDEVEATEELTFQMDDDINDVATVTKDLDENFTSDESLQDKLMQLCKRNDIIVAECDVPSGLMFVDEHHTMLQELPPLEPLDFGLDDFKLEVMRDSLLEVNDRKITSPICKINIDDILSSIKENASKVPESCSAFNLIDLERVPPKKERGFSVIENDKITSQEVKVDADKKHAEEKEEVMDKSSDDDVTSPVVSTDSDKDDKKNSGASNAVPPSLKQSAKSKKSRRKKK